MHTAKFPCESQEKVVHELVLRLFYRVAILMHSRGGGFGLQFADMFNVVNVLINVYHILQTLSHLNGSISSGVSGLRAVNNGFRHFAY